MLLVQRTASLYQLQAADLVIKPPVSHIRWDEMGRADELMTAGYDETIECMPEIKMRIEEAVKSAPKWYQLRRRREGLADPLTKRPHAS